MPPRNPFRGHRKTPDMSAADFLLVTPDDDADLPTITSGISITVSGPLAVHTARGVAFTFPAGSLVPGLIHPIRVRRVLESSDCGEIVAFYPHPGNASA